MGMGLGLIAGGSVLTVSTAVDLTCASSKHSLGERNVQKSCSATVTQCSTSGLCQSWGSSSRHGQRRRGKIALATKESQSLAEYGAVVVPVNGEESAEEVLLWLAPNSRRPRGKLEDSGKDQEEDRVGDIDQLEVRNNGDDFEDQGSPLAGADRLAQVSNSDDSIVDDGIRSEWDGPLDEVEKVSPQGWRGLGLGSRSYAKASLQRKPQRNAKAGTQGRQSTSISSFSPFREGTTGRRTREAGDVDAYLRKGLFKSLDLPQRRGRRTAVDKYFGDELKGRPGNGSANVSRKEGSAFEGEAGESRNSILRSPAVSEGGERLKINLDLELYRARCLRQKGRLFESENILTQCIRNWPDDGRPYVALGRQLAKRNKIKEARAVYESGCQAVRGENAYIWQAWAILEERTGDLAKARRLFDAATVADKKHAAAWHGWAKLELRADNLKRARSLLNKGLKYCGANEYLLQTLALIESRAGKIEQARSLLARATQHNPKSAASWLAWALMEAQNGLDETARRLFQKGIVASPKNRYVWQAWALFESRQGNRERARELFQRGHELNPKDAVLLQAFALFEFECGRPGLARNYFRRALACDSSHQPVWIAWGWMEWKQGNMSVARELYQGAIQVDSRSMNAARAFQAWGVLEEREGDSGLARELFKCALKIDSQNVPTWMSWAAMEEREGRSVRADEIRNLFLQQRTEVVDELPWDVNFSDFLAPAIDRIKGFFNVDQGSPWSNRPRGETDDSEELGSASPNLEGERISGSTLASLADDTEFNVELFLRQKFPWKYGSPELLKSDAVLESKDRLPMRQSESDYRDESSNS